MDTKSVLKQIRVLFDETEYDHSLSVKATLEKLISNLSFFASMNPIVKNGVGVREKLSCIRAGIEFRFGARGKTSNPICEAYQALTLLETSPTLFGEAALNHEIFIDNAQGNLRLQSREELRKNTIWSVNLSMCENS